MSSQVQAQSFQASEITPKMAFGIRTDFTNCIQCISSEKFVCIVGYYAMICKKHSTENVNFVAIQEEFGRLTAFAADDYNQDAMMLFLGQKDDEKNTINLVFKYLQFKTNIMEPKSMTVPVWDDVNGHEIIAAHMNCEAKLLCALIGPSKGNISGGQNFVLVYSLEGKTTTPTYVNKIKLSGLYSYKNLLIGKYETDKVAIWGNGAYAVAQAKGNLITEFGLNDRDKDKERKFAKCTFDFVACTWIYPKSVAFLDANCDVIILDYSVGNGRAHKGLIKGKVAFEGSDVNVDPGIALFEKDKNLFIANKRGLIVMYQNATTKKQVEFTKASNSAKTVDNLPPMTLECLAAGARLKTEKSAFCVVMATVDKQLYRLDMQNDNVIADGSQYKNYFCSYHQKAITSVDVARLKSTIATASMDKTVRIWNYLNNQLEVKQEFEETPIKVSFHPNGLHIAVLFQNKNGFTEVKCFDILEDKLLEIRQRYSYPINAKDIKFSNYGCMLAVCSKGFVKIFNFYTDVTMFDSNDQKIKAMMKGHSNNITTMCWDLDDTGIATCGTDGKVFYWDLNNMKQLIIYPVTDIPNYSSNLEYNFRDIQIMSEGDNLSSKRLLALNDEGIMEIYFKKVKDGTNESDVKTELTSDYLVKGKFSSIKFDQLSKILFYASPEDMNCGLTIVDLSSDNREKINKVPIPANSQGINSFVPSPDLRSLFTVGNDGTLFIFESKSLSKNTDTKEADTKEDMIIVPKADLDNNAINLRKELEEKDKEIADEEEAFKKFKKKKDREYKNAEKDGEEKRAAFAKDKEEIKQKLKEQEEQYNADMEKITQSHETEMKKLEDDRKKQIELKDGDKKEEEKLLAEERTKRQKESTFQKQEFIRAENKLKEDNKETIDNLHDAIDDLNKELEDLRTEVENDKEEKMKNNEKDIVTMRKELDEQKRQYEKVKEDHAQKSKVLKEEIDACKDKNKKDEDLKNSIISELSTFKNANNQLSKQIQDARTDIEEKERTINDKNELKKKLDKDNQELEKFKYVLHYKIKELKHTKEPKERKIQMMEKKAKDMEREIKTCEFQQTKIINELRAHRTMIGNLEKQIKITEEKIEKLEAYNKLFQESLYNSMKRAKNHKDCKREYVILKRNFLDKDTIEDIDRPFETNYEQQRGFLEKNVQNYKAKITGQNNLFNSDYHKVMSEKKKLIEIVNQLRKEDKEISKSDINANKKGKDGKAKVKNKEDIPKFGKLKKTEEGVDEDEEAKLRDYSIELKELQKRIEWYKYWKKYNKKKESEKGGNKNQEEVQEEDDDEEEANMD